MGYDSFGFGPDWAVVDERQSEQDWVSLLYRHWEGQISLILDWSKRFRSPRLGQMWHPRRVRLLSPFAFDAPVPASYVLYIPLETVRSVLREELWYRRGEVEYLALLV